MTTRAQFSFDFGDRPQYGSEHFLPAPCNEAALAWLGRWPDWPGPALAIHGPAGSGKTHLLHLWSARSDAALLDAAELTAAVVRDLAGRPVALDGADELREPAALFHLYNLQKEGGSHLLLAARTPPARWDHGLADLSSRLATAPAVELGLPDEALLERLVVKFAAERQLEIVPAAIRFLVARIERSFDAARKAVARLDSASLGTGRRITVPMAREVLSADDTKGED